MMQIPACRDRSDMGYVGFLIGSEAMTDALFLLDTDHDDVPVNSDELNAGWRLTLPSSVRRHAIQAMRLKDGDELQLSDGRGLRIHAVLRDAQQGIAEVLRFGKEPQPVTRLALVQALAKTGHDEQAIDMATQIGVDQVIPWQADRSIAKWKAGRTDKKWRQVLESATEQSRRSWTPQLDDCVTSKQVVAICKRACVHGDMVIVLHQDATKTWEQRFEIDAQIDALPGHAHPSFHGYCIAKLSDTCLKDGRPRTIYVLVGPEGGISDAEVEAFTKAGAEVCVLGSNILRASTAGPVALSLLARALGRFV